MELGFARALTRLQFLHRAVETPDGFIIYRLEGKTDHVRLTRAQWEQAGGRFQQDTRPSLRWATLMVLLSLPAYVIYAGLLHSIVPHKLALLLPGWLYFVIVLVPLPGMPIAIYLWHSAQVRRVASAIDAGLASFPRVPAPPAPRRSRPPLWFDLLCLLIIGPHLLIALIGEIDPGMLRNTPFSGRHLDPKAVAALALLALRWAWTRWARGGGRLNKV